MVLVSMMTLFIPAGTSIVVSVAVVSVGRLPINTSLCFEHVCTCNSHVPIVPSYSEAFITEVELPLGLGRVTDTLA